MCKNLYEYNTQYRKIIGEYLFPKGSTYILGQKYWGSTFKLGNKYWGSTFSQGVLLGVTTVLIFTKIENASKNSLQKHKISC